MGARLIAQHKLSPLLLELNTSLQRLQQRTCQVASTFLNAGRKFRMSRFSCSCRHRVCHMAVPRCRCERRVKRKRMESGDWYQLISVEIGSGMLVAASVLFEPQSMHELKGLLHLQESIESRAKIVKAESKNDRISRFALVTYKKEL